MTYVTAALMQTLCSVHIYGKSHENISFAKLTLVDR
jgi:hypothetical protein